MDLKRLHEILVETTVQVRKGEVVHGDAHLVQQVNEDKTELTGGGTVTFDLMPAESDLKPGLEIVDLTLLKVGVDKERAEQHRDELVELLKQLPQGQLAAGPSYIAVGAIIGDQGAAFQLFALGHVLKLWKVVTPKTLGITDPKEAEHAAGLGWVMITPPAWLAGKT